ncbi:telomerase inhibitor [Agyrium rufum]|nr:telomerase inhibitor [Agyrium rufum]
MGLSGPRKRTKISNDPNNTNWSRSTTSFGHKQLLSQGWTPGSNLGSNSNPSYAKFHTSASSSHIRVSRKDDTLGLGARVGAGGGSGLLPDQVTGLDGLQGLLGRLNGKTDVELQREEQKREEVRGKMYAASRWGNLGFMSGGVLEGTIKEVVIDEPKKTTASSRGPKRKVEDEDDDEVKVKVDEVDGSYDVKPIEAAQPERALEEDRATRKRRRKAEKEERRTERAERKAKWQKRTEKEAAAGKIVGSEDGEEQKKAQRVQWKAERRKRKEDEKKKKKKKKKKAAKESEAREASEEEDDDNEDEEKTETEAGSALLLATAAAVLHQQRMMLRRRQIMQKQAATADARALNEILMIKTPT